MSDLPANQVPDFVLNTPASEFVPTCYRKILAREGDPGGVAHYTSVFERNKDRLGVAADIAASDEAMSLPMKRKRPAVQVLAAHAHHLIRHAITRKQKQRAAARVLRYFSVVTGVDVQGSRHTLETDPFARYLHEVIEDHEST